jgi:hypothetical protein
LERYQAPQSQKIRLDLYPHLIGYDEDQLDDLTDEEIIIEELVLEQK